MEAKRWIGAQQGRQLAHPAQKWETWELPLVARELNGRSIFEGRWDHLFQQFITVVLDDPGFVLVKGSTAARRSGEQSFACARKLVYFIGKAHERPSPFPLTGVSAMKTE